MSPEYIAMMAYIHGNRSGFEVLRWIEGNHRAQRFSETDSFLREFMPEKAGAFVCCGVIRSCWRFRHLLPSWWKVYEDTYRYVLADKGQKKADDLFIGMLNDEPIPPQVRRGDA